MQGGPHVVAQWMRPTPWSSSVKTKSGWVTGASSSAVPCTVLCAHTTTLVWARAMATHCGSAQLAMDNATCVDRAGRSVSCCEPGRKAEFGPWPRISLNPFSFSNSAQTLEIHISIYLSKIHETNSVGFLILCSIHEKYQSK
jgi:hypothetical protein